MKIKKVMLIWGAAGGGHRSGMQALRDALLDLDPSVEVKDVDAFSRPWSYFPVTLVPWLYTLLVDHMPWAWALLFRSTDSTRGLQVIEQLTARLLSPIFEKPLRDFQPDIVVCVIHSVSGGLKRALRVVGQNPPIGVVVLDLVTFHQVWLMPEAAWFAMPTQEACQRALASGFSQDRLHLVGMPIRKMFWDPAPDRAGLRRRLDLPEDGPVTLVIGGAGFRRLEAIVDELLSANLPGYVAVVAVGDERARRRLAPQAAGRAICITGRVDNVSDWMWASDVVIAKAGPNVIYEAMRCQLPLILTDAIPGQETGNLDFVERHGLGLVATRPEQVAAAARRLLTEPGLADNVKSSMQSICQPDAARQIAKMILDGV